MGLIAFGRRHFEPTLVILTTNARRSARRSARTVSPTGTIAGTLVAIARRMAAVLCLIFLPLTFCSLFMIGSISSGPLTLTAFLAGVTFLLLAGGLVVGAMRLSRGWETEKLG